MAPRRLVAAPRAAVGQHKPSRAAAAIERRPGPSAPRPFSLDNYRSLLKLPELLGYFRNTFIVTFLVVAIAMVISSMAAFSLARMRFWGPGALLACAPPVVIYAFLMDYCIAGLTVGATKG